MIGKNMRTTVEIPRPIWAKVVEKAEEEEVEPETLVYHILASFLDQCGSETEEGEESEDSNEDSEDD